jgi:predicted transposase YbfD/YdcC
MGRDEWIAEQKQEWLRGFLELPGGIPSADTIARVFARTSAKQFSSAFSGWMKDVVVLTEGEIVAIDGKTLRRSHDKASGKAAIHMVSAWAGENGVVLGQVKVNEKSNEITAIPELLDLLAIKGCIVTIDAMGCQQDIAKKIIEANADYVLAVKDNQKLTMEAISEHFDTTKIPSKDEYETVEKGHGRIETRHYSVAPASDVIDLREWPACKSVAKITATREIKGEISIETRYYISSLIPNVKKIAGAIRGHWAIENNLHWVLDMAFDEDRSRVRREEAPENLATIRHVALNLINRETSFKGSVKRKRLKCAMSNEYLAKVLAGAN